jgi:hypothetical protein
VTNPRPPNGAAAFAWTTANYSAIVADPRLSFVGRRAVAERNPSLRDQILQVTRATALTTVVVTGLMTGFAPMLMPSLQREVPGVRPLA